MSMSGWPNGYGHAAPSASWANSGLAAEREVRRRVLHLVENEGSFLPGRIPESRQPWSNLNMARPDVREARDSIVLRCELGTRAYAALVRGNL